MANTKTKTIPKMGDFSFFLDGEGKDRLSYDAMVGAWSVLSDKDWEMLRYGGELYDLEYRLNESVCGGHSGLSMSWTIFQLKAIASNGWKRWVKSFVCI